MKSENNNEKMQHGVAPFGSITEEEYVELLKTAVTQINSTRNSLVLQLNASVNSTYWNLGKLLHDKEIKGGYGSSTIKRLSTDLKSEFPDMGLSPRNLWYMKSFYERYEGSSQKVQRAVALLTWSKNILLMQKSLNDDEVLFYASQ